MDLFGGMPQVKTAVAVTGNSVYTTVPIDQSELSNQSLGRAADVAKYKSDILASSAWSAVIHHPAEDSEPDELPSTVDMDAIKEPPTPLPAPCTPGGTIHSQNEDEEEEDEEEEGDDEDDDDDSESDSDDADSDSETGNESNTESEEGGSRSDGEAGVGTLSESESEESQGSAVIGGAATRRRYRRSSSTSSHSSLSDSSNGGGGNKQQLKQKKKEKKKIASPEMAYEQGGEHYYRSRQTDPANPMKVKISALKLSSSKQQQQQQQHRPSSGHQLVASSIRLRSSRTKLVNDVVTSQSAPVTATPTAAAKKRNAAIDAKQATGSEVSSSDEDGDGEEEEDEEDDDDDDRRERGGEEEKDEITQLAQEFVRPSSTLPISEHLQVINQEDLAAILPDVVGVGGGPFDGFEDVNGSGPTSQGPAAAAAAAARKAAAGKGGGRVGELEGGDDVGGGGGGGETETSSSDTEMLPDVTAVINRIDRMDDDSDGQRASGASDDEDDDDEDDGDDAESETDEVGYRSNLLQRFNQQTEQISAGNRGGVRPVLEATEGAGSRRRRGRPPKLTVAATSSGSCIHHHHKHHHHHQPGGAGAPPELEPVYCSASNVSPDSGIQSVAGSPAHHQLCASPSPPQAAPLSQRHHSPANSAATTGRVPANSVAPPPRRGKKAGTGDAGDARHFGRTPETITKNVPPYDKTSSRSARPVEADEEAEEVDEKEEEEEEEHLLPRLLHAGPMAAGGKRGPGRPKKTPPTLEPNLPIGEQHKRTTTARKEGHHHHHHHHHHKHRHHHHHHNLQHSNSNNSLLNEICEQVSKRLDIVDDASQSQTPPPPLLSLNGEMKKKQPKLKPTRRHHHNKHNHNKHRHEGTSSSKSFPLKLQLEHRLKTAPLKVKPTYVAKNGRRHSSVTGLAVGKHHKHKKRKRRSSGMDMKSGTFKLVDPNFLTDLDQLVGVFDKLCHIRPRPKSPTLSVDVKKVGQECVVADVKKLSPPGQEASKKLSPIDRTKMVDVKSSPAVGGRSLSKNGGASSKKRKAEKVGRNCEKESVVVGVVVVEGSENVVGGVVDQQQSVVVSPAATVKRSRVKKTSAIGGEVLSKSRGDKPSVEVTSANNNEQRLPLKKRHYHMSTSTPQHQSAVDWESSSPDSSDAKSGSGKSKSDSSSVASSESLTLGGKAKSADTTRSGLSKSVGGSAQVLEKSKAGITKPDALEVEEEAGGGKMAAELVSEQQHRDSIDEAIEACINKYSDGDCVVGGEGGGASLISTTPKKRHRIDVDEKREGVQMKGVGKPQATVTSASQPKRASSRSLSATNHHSLTATSTTTPAVTARVKRTSSRIAVPVTVTTASSQNHSGVTSKRVSARSASATVESTATKTAVSATAVPSKRPHLRSSSSSTTTNTLTTTSATTTTTATMTTASSGQVLSTSTNVDKSKRTTSRHAAVTPSGTTTTPSRSTQTKPPAGVFEPSTKIDDLVSCLPKITPLPPVKAVRPAVIHVLNKLTERLKGLEEVVDEKTDEVSVFRSLRTKRAAEDETDQEEASVSRSLRTQRVQEVASDDDLLKCNSKKRKLLKDVRVHVTKLLPSDLVVAKDEVAAVVVKQKVKRRKAINRTGFPAKKKKKKKVVVAAVLEDGCSPLPPPVLEDQTKLVPVDCPLFVDVTPALSPMMTVTPRTKCDETADRLQQEPITTPRRPARESVRQKSVSVGSSSNNNNNNNNNAVLDIKSVIQELKSRKDSVMERKRKEKEEADLMSREDKEEKRKRMKESVEEVELRLGDVVGGSVEVEDRTRRKKKGDEEEEDNEEEECEDGEKGERTRRTKKEKGVVVVMNSRRPQRKAAQPKNDEKKKEEKDSCKEETEMKENLEDSSKKRQMVEKKRTDGKVVERRSLKDITCDRKQKDKVKKKEEEDGGVVVGGGEEREVGGGVGLDKKSVERKLKDVIEKRTRLKEEAVVERKARKTNEETIEVEEVKVEEEEEKVMQDEKSPQDECGGGGGGGGLSSSSCKKIRHKSPRHSHNRRTEASRRRKRKRNGLIKHKKRKGKSKVGVMRSGRIRSKRMKQKSGEAERDENNCSDEDKLAPSRQPPVAVATSPPRRRKKKVSVPRWRKRYLAAGLFSDLYKTEAGEQLRRPALDASGSRTVYRPEEHQWGLMPPPHYCAKWVRQRRVPFQLPHDLWWLHKNSRLPGRDVVPSWNHKKIRTNVYYDVKPSYMYEAQACNCNLPPPPTSQQQLIPAAQPSKVMTSATNGCGEDCINRLIYTECSPRLCPCRQLCTNQRIQRHEWAPGLVKFMTPNKGWGVKTKHAIRTGEFILEYVGEVVSEREFKNRMASRYHSDTHHYCLNLDGGLVIDGHRMGGDGRFVNHSCEPNCEMQKWSVNGLFRMALFALRDIEPHEELTYDYNFALFNPAEGQPCKCGSRKCRGVIGGKYQRVSVIKESQENASSLTKSRKKSRKGQVDPKQSKGGGVANKSSVGSAAAAAKETVNKETQASSSGGVGSTGTATLATIRANQLLPPKPLTAHQQELVKSSRVLLLRNFEKVKRCREKLKQRSVSLAAAAAVKDATAAAAADPAATTTAAGQDGSGVFLSQLNALSTARNVRTRRLKQAQDDPEVTRVARLAHLLRGLHAAVANAKEENGESLASGFAVVPSKRRQPDYHELIQSPIDLNTIEARLKANAYRDSVVQFDGDMRLLFANCQRYFGRVSQQGKMAARLARVYATAKRGLLAQIEQVLGEPVPASFVEDDGVEKEKEKEEQEEDGDEAKGGGVAVKKAGEEEDVIRCVCGMLRDEGVMIQCERCLVWQHCDCVRADAGVEHYLCERCDRRAVDKEIRYDTNPEYATEGQIHYMTLLRGQLQVRQGDTVYVLRDIPNEETGTSTTPPSKHNYKTIKVINYNDCDIFRIERLWKDEKGDRFVFGHHYLRPHETYHEPTRKFFTNEVMRVPLYEVVPIELVMGHCYVLDPATYCKGRPRDADMRHVYICEYRVDKTARLFAKLARPRQPPVCTKSYAFDKYEQRLKISRTYTPHGPPPSSNVTSSGSSSSTSSSSSSSTTTASKNGGSGAVSRNRGGRSTHAQEEQQRGCDRQDAVSVVMTTNAATNTAAGASQLPVAKRADQKQRLNEILLRLLARAPSKQVLDISYLLEPGRRNRKRPALLSP